LPATPGDQQQRILGALGRLKAGGSTDGGAGIRLAYQVARENYIPRGVNRVILCTDGDFNVGTTSTAELIRLASEQASTGVYLSVLGFGMGNHNDAMLEQVSNQSNGNYAFIDSEQESQKVLLDQLQSTLVTIAKDVKIQVEFNPRHVAAYRLIGYENRRLKAQDFNDDRKDAGEVGAGHAVTALYEIVPARGEDAPVAAVDPLKYQTPRRLPRATDHELMTVKLRYKHPEGDRSRLLVVPVENRPRRFASTSRDFQFAAAVAAFGMLLRQSDQRGNSTYDAVSEIARDAQGWDPYGYRREFLEMVARAKRLSGETGPSVGFAPWSAPHARQTHPRTLRARTYARAMPAWSQLSPEVFFWIVLVVALGIAWGLGMVVLLGTLFWQQQLRRRCAAGAGYKKGTF